MSTPAPSSTPPSIADWKWVSVVFRERGGFLPYSTSFAVRIHNRNQDLIRRLKTTFGGRVYAVGGTLQWRIAGEPMRQFLEGVKPYLVNDARADRMRVAVEKALARLTEKAERVPGEAVLDRIASDLVDAPLPRRPRKEPKAKPAPKAVEGEEPAKEEAAPAEPEPEPLVFLEPDEEPFGRVPPGPPWDAKQVLFELAADAAVFPDGMVLEADSEEQARAFASAAPKTLRGEASGFYVRLRVR